MVRCADLSKACVDVVVLWRRLVAMVITLFQQCGESESLGCPQ